MGEFTSGKQLGKNAFEVLLLDYWRLARTFNVLTMKSSILNHTREQAIPLLLRLETFRGNTSAI
jgi:hypothetical protein